MIHGTEVWLFCLVSSIEGNQAPSTNFSSYVVVGIKNLLGKISKKIIMKINKNKNQIKSVKNTQGNNKSPYDSLNPLILAKQILIKGENKREFIEFVEQLRVSLHINTHVEEEIFKKYIFSSWKLRRMREIEKNLLNNQQVFEKEKDIFTDWGTIIPKKEPVKKRRIRNISMVYLNDEIQEVLNFQDKLEKQTTKILRQLREEQHLLKEV